MIELRDLCAGYGKRRILRHISVDFPSGKLTAVVGPNGSGKTTLLKAAAAILPIESGSLTVNGEDILRMKSRERARRIAYLSQGRGIPDMTAEQTVLHGRFAHLPYPYIYTAKDREAAAAAMARMGICDYARMPMDSLSGGMRQNVYLAMAIAQETDYIFLDEPTTYLDIANRFRIMDTLRMLADGGKGIVAVLHDLDLAMEYADEIMVMENGVCVSKDTPERLRSKGIWERVFGVSLQPIRTEDGRIRYMICR